VNHQGDRTPVLVKDLHQVVVGQEFQVLGGISMFPVGMGDRDKLTPVPEQVQDMLLMVQVLVEGIIQPEHFFCPDEKLVLFSDAESVLITGDIKRRIPEMTVDALVI
jgi:hypothetical protein